MIKNSKINIKIVIIFMSFCQGLQFSISPVLKKIQDFYPDISVGSIQMLITAPALMAAVIAVLSGWLVTKVSKKKLILLGSLVTGISGLIPFYNTSFILLFMARIFLGIGLGLITALNTAVVAEHFEGKERVAAMGLQGASVGTGMLLITTASGFLGVHRFQFSYFIHILGIIATLIIWRCLPDTGKVVVKNNEKIRLNKKVYMLSLLGMVEFIFLISFSTNIAMHIGGNLAGNPSVAGVITGVFSGVQIIFGLMLSVITKYTKEKTMIVAMSSFGLGALLLVVFPGNYIMLILGAVFCGASQGIFIPQAMYEASNAVSKIATAMAAASITVAMCLGQLVSPVILNGLSKLLFGHIATSNVFAIGTVVMFILPLFLFVIKKGAKKNEVLDRC